MAEIVFGPSARAVVIPGMEAYNDSAVAHVVIPKCALIELSANGADLNTKANPMGVALETGDPGDQAFSYGKRCEVSGFTNVLTPGYCVWPSAAVPGGLVDGAPTVAVPAGAIANSKPCGSISADGKRIVFNFL